eukprot:s2356_g4.t1
MYIPPTGCLLKYLLSENHTLSVIHAFGLFDFPLNNGGKNKTFHHRGDQNHGALNSLVFLLFLLCLPFCFQVMPPNGAHEVALLERPELTCGECPCESFQRLEFETKASTDAQRCTETDRISLVSFLVALIGGGVFSLDAFEAFPML